jgi:hypothetical protein
MTVWDGLGLGLALAAGLGILAARDWRWRLGFAALQYAAVFVWVAGIWGLELAAVKLAAGWVALAILGSSSPGAARQPGDAGALFRALVFALVALAAWSVAPQLVEWVPSVSRWQGTAAIVLAAVGLVLMGMSRGALANAAGQLVFLSGFELAFASQEQAALLAGLLAAVNLAVALAGAYLDAGESPPAQEAR